MNRTIAAWTIAVVAVLGLTACSGSPSASEPETDDSSTSEEAPAETTTDQSVADACAVVVPALTEASSSMSGLSDMEAAASDPQGTVDAFNETVASIGEAADSVTNAEVKEAATALHEQYTKLGDLLSAVLIDQDASAASDMSTLTTDLMDSATELSTLCAG
ncbi:hypothetical protein [Microbacterium sp. CIAB417]|uniref:hypothetical protein n=1 Tax=Microbacterium sp. CIAB417 TaxID=2860287 RepID=UPI001FAB73E8|nr:hypothetical protein [Microbacterium sp. CIAB417]